jgi:hypothetical protein
MISEAMGKILGMAMAYGVSALGLFLAYANYRKRILKADKVMTPRAWGVVIAILAAIGAGVLVVAQLAEPQAASPETVAEAVDAPAETVAATPAPRRQEGERDRWPLLGILAPAVIFLFATWVTAALYRHFATHGHGGPAAVSPRRHPDQV